MVVTNYSAGDNDTRPWGQWTVLEAGPNFTVKTIKVDVGQRLSLQYHRHRSEHWVVVQGHGQVTLGGDRLNVEPGSHLYIPSTTRHRIHNTGDNILVFVEVQFGEHLDENDIVRVEDDYDRLARPTAPEGK